MSLPPLWTADDVAAATDGQATQPARISGVSIDSRTLSSGDLFVALAGPNFDGHEFVDEAFKAGAATALVSRPGGNRPLILVNDTFEALTRLGAAGRRRASARIAAVTGSVGKTGTKMALAHVLADQGKTCAGRGNLNNHWGVPLSLARMPDDVRYGVFEIGMNHAGEITPLSALVRPHVAIVTGIAMAHMENFNSLADIARAKSEIFSGLDNGIAVINRDSAHYDLMARTALEGGAREVIGFGRHDEAEMRLVRAWSDNGKSRVEATWRGSPLSFRIGVAGAHWAGNSLAVLAAVHGLGGELERAARSLESLPPMPGRGAIHVLRWGSGTLRLIDDSYNANPDSMRSALRTLGQTASPGERRVAVLGDMLELGRFSRDAHVELSRHIEENEIDLVFLGGSEVRCLADSLNPSRIGGIAETADRLLPLVIDGLESGDVVTVKASNSVNFAAIVDGLLNRSN